MAHMQGGMDPHEMTTAEIVASQSQDYIDEKELEYLQTIQQLADEQERVQKKTFVNWINCYLAQHIPPYRIEDLIEDIRDGTKLIALLEVLSGEKLPMEKGRILRRPHFLSNVNTALQFLERKRVKLVNINASDVVDGRHTVVLGLIWTIILFFQIEENTRLLAEQIARMPSSSTSSLESAGSESDAWGSPKRKPVRTPVKEFKSGARKALMHWVRNVIPRKYGILITDFGASWRDGFAFLALISSIRPDLIDWERMQRAPNRVRLQTAFDLAESELGIARLLDEEDVDVAQPDEKSMMTYVAQFLHKFPEIGVELKESEPVITTDFDKSEYENLSIWLNKAETTLQQRKQISQDKHWEYSQYATLKNEMDQRQDSYNNLRSRVESRISSVTPDMWSSLERRWLYVAEQLRYWQRQLDSSLPGALGQIGEWLFQAEQMLQNEIPSPKPSEDPITFIGLKLEEHKMFFKDLPKIQHQFHQLSTSSMAADVPPAQIENMMTRLHQVTLLAQQRQLRLEFEEQKQLVLEMIKQTKLKLQKWGSKYGSQHSVQELLEDYKAYVDADNVYLKFDKVYSSMQKAADLFKKGAHDQKEIESVGKFLRDINEQWRQISVELQCMRSMLEQVYYCWQRYLANHEALIQWLDKAEVAAEGSEDIRTEFFQDLNVWKEAYLTFNEVGTFLQSACEESYSNTIRQQMALVNQRWERLFQKVQEYLVAGELLKNRHEYRSGINRLKDWVNRAEELLSTDKTCSADILQAIVQQLQQMQQEGEDMENLFKIVSKKAQSLIQEVSREDVDRMMVELKRIKEALVRIRATIPSRLYLYHQLLAQLEALEQGITEVSQWLNEAEMILQTYAAVGSRDKIQETLEKHKAFFSRTVYYKSMLESKNKVYQSIMKSVDGSQGIETSAMKDQMNQLNWQFQKVLTSSRQWEQRMEKMLQMWLIYRENERALTDWINEATKLFSEKTVNDNTVVEQHKDFFSENSENLIQDLIKSAHDLKNVASESEFISVQETVNKLQSKWREVVNYAPLHLLKLEFRLDETTFQQYVRDIEKELNAEQLSFSKNENIDLLLKRHEDYFERSGLLLRIATTIEALRRLSAECLRLNPTDPSTTQTVWECEQQWQQLQQKIRNMHDQLKQIPGQWKEYRQRYASMEKWMDDVETAIVQISEEAVTFEEFEELKFRFQTICEEVDNRRADMKWLVQTLDALVSHSSDEEAIREQKNLEALIARYKSLLPNIETTMVRVDTVSKCFVYREEIHEVKSWLKDTGKQAIPEGHSDTLNKLDDAIRQQELLIRQLEEQKGKILSSVQRGRDLQQDPNAPSFVKYEVQGLEDRWKEAYNQAVSKLNQMKGTQKIWSDYEEQKAEIFRLLQQAEDELRKMSGSLGPALPKELRSKQDLSIQLREATEAMLEKLRELSASLMERASAQQRPLLEKEVTEIEKRLHVVMTTVQEKVVYMEQITIKWTNYTLKIDEFSNWLSAASQQAEEIKLSGKSPEYRMSEIKELQSQVDEKEDILRCLEREGAELISVDPSSDQAKALKSQLSDLRREMDTLQSRLHGIQKMVSEELSHWESYHSSKQEFEPWLIKSEAIISQGQPRPATLNEAEQFLQQSKSFYYECEVRGKQLENLMAEGEQVETNQGVVTELDTFQSRWQSIRDTVSNWLQNGNFLVNNWTELIGKMNMLSKQLKKQDAELQKPFDISSPNLEHLERQMEHLKLLNKETTEMQAQAITLVQDCDKIAPHINPDAASSLRNDVSEIKNLIAKLLEKGRMHQTALSDVIINRQEFYTKLSSFQTNVQQLEQRLGQLHEVFSDRVEQALETVKTLNQETQDLQPAYNFLSQEMKALNEQCDPGSMRNLNAEYSLISGRYKKLEELLDLKEMLFKQWIDFTTWQVDVNEQLRLHEQSIEAKRLSPEEIQQTSKEVASILTAVPNMEKLAEEIEQLMERSCTVIKERSNSWPISPHKRMLAVHQGLSSLKMQLGLKEEQLERLGSQREEFEQALFQMQTFLKDFESRLDKVKVTKNSPAGLAEILQTTQEMLDELSQQQNNKVHLHEKSRSLLQADPSQYTAVQAGLEGVDSCWDKLTLCLVDRNTQFSSTLNQWQNCSKLYAELCAALQQAQQYTQSQGSIPEDASQVQSQLEKAKAAQLALTKLKPQMDQYMKKSSQIVQQLSTIPGFKNEDLQSEANALKQKWLEQTEALAALVQNLESQLVVWHQIEQNKAVLNSWLSTTCTMLDDTLHKLGGAETATSRVEKYRNELPTYEQIYQGLISKMQSLENFNNGQKISTLEALKSSLASQFEHAAQLAQALEGTLGNVAQEEAGIHANMQQIVAWITSARERLANLDNLTGGDQEIFSKLQEAQKLGSDFKAMKPQVNQIEDKIKLLKTKYAACEVSHLYKEFNSIQKRFESLESQAFKVQQNLYGMLEKRQQGSQQELQRWIATNVEKVSWCNPDLANDRYSIEAKLTMLQEIANNMGQGEEMKKEFLHLNEILYQVASPERRSELDASKTKIEDDLKNLKACVANTQDQLNKTLDLWQQYEISSESLASWLRETETKVRSDTSVPPEPHTAAKQKEKIEELMRNIQAHETDVKSLLERSEKLCAASPESRVTTYANQLSNRYNTLGKLVQDYLQRLQQLLTSQGGFEQAVENFKQWMCNAEEDLRVRSEAGPSGEKPTLALKGKLMKLKELQNMKESGQAVLSVAFDSGEALFPTISADGREKIRSELRSLRDWWEGYWDRVNGILKKLEIALMQWDSFDDNCRQVENWLEEIKSKIGTGVQLRPSLHDKKLLLQNYKTIAQDISSHAIILSRLSERAKEFMDESVEESINQMNEEHKELSKIIKSYIEVSDRYVSEHDQYQQKIEEFLDWLSTVQTELSITCEPGEITTLQTQLGVLKGFEKYKSDGEEKLEALETQLLEILEHTDSKGHPILKQEYENLHDQWDSFNKKLSATEEHFQNLLIRCNQCEASVEDLSKWLQAKEMQVKEISLKPDLESKQAQLEKLKAVAEEINEKQSDFTAAVTSVQTIEGDSRLGIVVAQLNSRYQTLRNNIKEVLAKWEQIVKDHITFNERYSECQSWLTSAEDTVSEESAVTGDMQVLEERKMKLEELLEQKSMESSKLDSVVELGEKLYPHTAPDGRETIRQQLRLLRDQWETLGGNLTDVLRKLETCLQEFEAFSQSQEQLTRWLREIEQSMEQHTELKSTMQEKQAQLQNHKIVHQEIMSHQPLLENVCERAQHLAEQTGDESLHIYINSIKQLYYVIGEKSQDLLNKLETCVKDHQQFHSSCKAFQEWLEKYKEQIQALSDTSGDKAKLNLKLDTLKDLIKSQSEGEEQLNDLKKLCSKVCIGTSNLGVEQLHREVQILEENWKSVLASCVDLEKSINEALDQWSVYEASIESLGLWSHKMENQLREIHLQGTLEEKESQLQVMKSHRDSILQHEAVFDKFSDDAHSLLQTSGVDFIKAQVAQLSSRFQIVLAASKDLINKWQSIVDDHRTYQQKLTDVENWLSSLESSLNLLNSEEDMEERMRKLQLVIVEKERGGAKLNSVTSLGERLYPDTAATGREIIRQELRNLRERWDNLDVSIENHQKHVENQNQQWLLYNEGLQQLQNWLEVMEKALQAEQGTWSTVQEAKAKILRYKALQQDVLSHKRMIETLKEKAAVLSAPSLKDTVADISQRYDNLCSNIRNLLSTLEIIIEELNQYYELHQSHSEWQKAIWDRLSVYTDYSGNKQALQTRLEAVKELEGRKKEGDTSLELLNDHAEKLLVKLPPRSKEVLDREHQNLRHDFEKLGSTIEDVRRSLENRLHQWAQYEEDLEQLLRWFVETENSLKEFTPKSTLKEKVEQQQKYQNLVSDIRGMEKEADRITDASQELVQVSGEVRLSVGVQQIASRYQSLHITCKEVVKKCEQHVNDHQLFQEKYEKCSNWLREAQDKLYSCSDTVGDRSTMESKHMIIKELLQEQASSVSLLNATVELGEKLYPSTAQEGRDVIHAQLQDLQAGYEALFDNLAGTDQRLRNALTAWSGLEENLKKIQDWIRLTQTQLGDNLQLQATLDDKKTQLQVYRVILHDVLSHQQVIVDLKQQAKNIPDRDDNLEETVNKLWNMHQDLHQRAMSFVESYEQLVSDHQQYSTAVYDAKSWLSNTKLMVGTLGDTTLERISLQSNLERLKSLLTSLTEEEHRITRVQTISEKVITGSSEKGQEEIRKEVDGLQQTWHALLSYVKGLIESLENQLSVWSDYDQCLEDCSSWLREVDTKLHAVDLKATLEEKQNQLEMLKGMQGQVRAKELEIDAVIERAHHLYQATGGHRSSVISELGMRYQQVVNRIKELVGKWQHYVVNHQDYESQLEDCKSWLASIRNKLTHCSDLSAASHAELEAKLGTIQDLLLYKEEGFGKIQSVIEQAQVVLANTAPSGHESINQAVANLQEEWSELASKMVETKVLLDDTIHRWSGFLEQIHQLLKIVEQLETGVREVAQHQAIMSEKRAQIEKLKSLSEKVRCEKAEVEGLKIKADELAASGQQEHAASQAHDIISRFMAVDENIKVLAVEREQHYKDHRAFKAACDDLISWINSMREKSPLLSKSLSDRLALEAAVTALEQLQGKRAAGQLKVDHMFQTGEVVLASTSSAGQDIIISEMKTLQGDFEGLFKDIQEQKNHLEQICIQWREYKDEYERVSEWLQVTEADLKSHKTALKATLDEKRICLNQCKDLNSQLIKGQETMDNLNKRAQLLLASHLDTYVNNQLRHMNSRYQVLVNLAKDVLKKIEQNYDHHHQYEEYSTKARAWIENARQTIKESSDTSGLKDTVQTHLYKVQDLLKKQDEGQALVNNAVSWGEKALRNTRTEGREVINRNLQELQTDWDRLVKKISNAKVSLETSLLQWSDYSSSYKQLQQWLSDREEKLQQVLETKIFYARKGLPERKATLRKTNSLVQDIVAFEPMIESVNYKAEELLQKSPTSKLCTDATEITSKYKNLTKQARDIFEQQKQLVEQHQSFMDATTDFSQWLRSARESLSKCSEPVGDKEMLLSKNNQLKLLLLEEDTGAAKLRTALDQGQKALGICQEEEQQLIAEEMSILQDEFDQYKKALADTKSSLEVGLVKWTEYEDLFKKCCEWLSEKEGEVQSYLKLQSDLVGKRMQLEKFQILLQTIFDWQIELDRLNVKAQLLLETCSDSRVSNAVTQITTKYNALLSVSKEVMRRLEQHFQEHQQQQCIYTECNEWIEKTRERLDECSKLSENLDELNNKVQILKNLKTTMEQGQHKLRYAMELKEKIILNTDPIGAAKIQENTENLQQEFDKLLTDISKTRQALMKKITEVEEHRKGLRLFTSWLQEMEDKVGGDSDLRVNELSERKALLEKYRSFQRDIASHEELANQLKAKCEDEDKQKPAIKEITESLERYNKLVDNINEKVKQLTNQCNQHDEYHTAQQAATDWLLRSHLEAQDCCDCTGDRHIIECKLEKHSKLVNSMPEGEALIQKAKDLGHSILPYMNSEGEETIQKQLEQLESEWEHLNSMCSTAKTNLNSCLEAWTSFEQLFQKQFQWLWCFQDKIKAETEAQEVNRSEENLKKFQQLFDEASKQKPAMTELNERGEALMEQSSSSRVREQTVQLLSMYSSLTTTLQGLLNKMEKSLADHSEYLRVKKDFDTWIQQCRQTLDENSGVIGDEDTLESRLGKLKMLSANISEGQQMLHNVCEVGARALNTVPAANQGALRSEMTGLQKTWEAFTLQLSQAMSCLKAAISRLQDYMHDHDKLEQWFKEKESILSVPPHTAGNVIEIKTQLEKYKHLQGEIESKGSDINDIQSEAEELATKTGNNSVMNSVTNLKKLQNKLLQKCKDLITKLGTELEEFQLYQLALQETEKWLLHTSFQLMAHNSLYIHSLEQTQEQIEQHQIMLAEIKSYQTTLDDVKSRGNNLIDAYQDVANNVCTEIQQQLTNIQESYDALLKTANQIEKRLQDSYQKFKEYEDALDIISTNLTALEPPLAKEQGVVPQSLEEARNHQNSIRNISNKLNVEKQRLQAALQSCEDATASLSRPSSPEGGIPSLMPEKETNVRLRLEDMIDQVENIQLSISRIVNEWEELERCREELRKWLTEQQNVIADFQSKPARLRPEVAQGEINQIQYLKTQIDEKRQVLEDIEQKQQNLSPDFQDPSLKEELEQLEQQVADLLEARLKVMANIDEYRQLNTRLQAWFDQITKQVEILDRGDGMDSTQKADKLKELQQEFDGQQAIMEDLKTRANDAIPELGGTDAQQVEEQLKGVNKKFSELQKRVQRKAQVIEMIRQSFENLLQEILSTQEWLKQKIKEIEHHPPLGYQSSKVEGRVQEINTVKREIENKTVIIENIEHQVQTVSADLEGHEKDKLHVALNSLLDEYRRLQDLIRKALEFLAAALAERQLFERTIDNVLQWLQEKNLAALNVDSTPLHASAIEKFVENYKRIDIDVKSYDDSVMNELRKQAQGLAKDCTDEDREKLEALVKDLESQVTTLKKALQDCTRLLSEQLIRRQDFEKALNKCQHWLHQADVAVTAEIRPAATMDVVQEQLQKYSTLLHESGTISEEIRTVSEQGQKIKPEVSEVDRLNLQEQLDNLRDRHNRLASVISERVSSLERIAETRRQQEKEVHESITILNELQFELRSLNRPVGHSVKDAQELLDNYQAILRKLQELQDKLEQLQKLSLESSSELEALLRQLQEYLQQVQNQIAKLKQTVMLRQQFQGLISDIAATIAKYTEIVNIIEKSETTVTDKIRRYQEVMQKLIECDATLMSAMDKGQQIGAEGSAVDRNLIMDQLQNLKMQLNNLKRTVEKKKSEHEVLAAELNKLRQELEDLLDRLHAHEATVKSRPLLTLDPRSVNEELRKHKALSLEVHSLLNKLQGIRTRLHQEHEVDLLPAALHEHLSEAKLLASTLPTELDGRERYLLDALTLRQQYNDIYERLVGWIGLANAKLQRPHDGVDFENIANDLQDHKTFFKEGPLQNQRLEQLQELASKISPSLSLEVQETLQEDLNHQEQQLRNILSSAIKKQSNLESDAQSWDEYKRAIDKVELILESCDFSVKSLDSLAAVAAFLQRMNDHNKQIQKHQEVIDDLNEKARKLDRRADFENRNNIKKQIDNIHQRWRDICHQVDNQKLALQEVHDKWDKFTQLASQLNTSLTTKEQQLLSLSQKTSTKAQLDVFSDQLRALEMETLDLQSMLSSVHAASSNVLISTTSLSDTARKAIEEEVKNLSSRYTRLCEAIQQKLHWIQDEITNIENLESEVVGFKIALENMQSDIDRLDVYDPDEESVDRTAQQMKDHVNSLGQQVRSLCESTQTRYSTVQQAVPAEVSKQLSSLELLAETVSAAMDDKEREFKRARTTRFDYVSDVEAVQFWLQQAESKLRDKSVTIQSFQENVQRLQSEIEGISEKLMRINKNGQLLCERTQNLADQELIRSTVAALNDQMQQVRSLLEDRRSQVDEIQEAWQRFLQSLESLKAWIEKTRAFLAVELQFTSLTHTKQKLTEYQSILKECPQAQRYLADMAKELSCITQVCSAGELPEKLAEADCEKAMIEKRVQEQVAMLQEMTEEWEQCEKKVREVTTWLEKSRQSLESTQNKKKPLREQLNMREKLLADITIQKTKLQMSVEKLGVHLRNTGGSENQVVVKSESLQQELDTLQAAILEQNKTLESCIAQVDNYQQEIMRLKNQVTQAEHQLRVVSSPTFSPRDRKKQLSEQNACREKIKLIQEKVAAVNERVKGINQRGTPDTEPLYS